MRQAVRLTANAGRESADVEDGLLSSSMGISGSVVAPSSDVEHQGSMTKYSRPAAQREPFQRDEVRIAEAIIADTTASGRQLENNGGSPIYVSTNDHGKIPWQQRLRRRFVPSGQGRTAQNKGGTQGTRIEDISYLARRVLDEYDSVTDLVEREVDEWSEVWKLNDCGTKSISC